METILAAIDNSPYSPAVAEYAAVIAKPAGATVVGLYIVDIRLVEGSYGRILAAAMGHEEERAREALAALLEANGRQGLDIARAICDRYGVPFDQRIERGRPAQVIARLAPAYDIAVVGECGADAQFTTRLMGSTLQELLRIIARPLLIARRTFRPINSVLIGYDGSPEATKAADMAITLAAAAGWSVTIAIAEDWGIEADKLQAQAHNFKHLADTQHQIIVRSGDAPHVLLELDDELSPGLIAVGSRGRARLRELLVGSTSLTLVREAKAPVLVYR